MRLVPVGLPNTAASLKLSMPGRAAKKTPQRRERKPLFMPTSHRGSTTLLQGSLQALDVVEISIELRIDRETWGEVVCEACPQAKVSG